MPEPNRRTGGCHCGRVRYEVETDLASILSCNCSICTKHGFLWSFVPEPRFTLLSGEGDLTEYQFHKHVIHHLFCNSCGVESFARGTMPDGAEVVALNVRCLDGIEIGELALTPVDGRSV